MNAQQTIPPELLAQLLQKFQYSQQQMPEFKHNQTLGPDVASVIRDRDQAVRDMRKSQDAKGSSIMSMLTGVAGGEAAPGMGGYDAGAVKGIDGAEGPMPSGRSLDQGGSMLDKIRHYTGARPSGGGVGSFMGDAGTNRIQLGNPAHGHIDIPSFLGSRANPEFDPSRAMDPNYTVLPKIESKGIAGRLRWFLGDNAQEKNEAYQNQRGALAMSDRSNQQLLDRDIAVQNARNQGSLDVAKLNEEGATRRAEVANRDHMLTNASLHQDHYLDQQHQREVDLLKQQHGLDNIESRRAIAALHDQLECAKMGQPSMHGDVWVDPKAGTFYNTRSEIRGYLDGRPMPGGHKKVEAHSLWSALGHAVGFGDTPPPEIDPNVAASVRGDFGEASTANDKSAQDQIAENRRKLAEDELRKNSYTPAVHIGMW